jgi:hypothetical protein
VHYTRLIWATGKVFQLDRGPAASFATTGVIPASGRRSSAKGRIPGHRSHPSGGWLQYQWTSFGRISGTGILVFVVDILATSRPIRRRTG